MQAITPNTINDATLLSSNVAENDYPVYSISAAYGINDTVIYISTNTHWVVRSLVANNQGNIPTGLDTDTKWVKVSETNRWKMFDLKTTSQTVNTSSIEVTIANTTMSNGMYAGGLDATSITVVGVDQFDVQIYSSTVSLVDNSNVYDPWTYFFAPLLYKSDFVISDLPPYSLTKYTVTISKPASTAKCGTLLFGQVTDFGETNYGMTMGILDYSVKRANDFGDFVLTQRSYSKTLGIDVRVTKGQTDPLMNYAARYRAVPLVLIGYVDYTSSYVYGFFKDTRGVVDYLDHSLFKVEFEGLS